MRYISCAAHSKCTPMTRVAFRVIYRRFMRCGTNTCLKLLIGAGGVLSFYVQAIYSVPEVSRSSNHWSAFGSFFRHSDFLFPVAVIALTAGLFYVVHRCESRNRRAEMLLRRLYGERSRSLVATLVAETLLLTGVAVVAGLVLIDMTYYYFRFPAEGWKAHIPGLMLKSALMGMTSGAAVAWHTCRHNIVLLLEKLREQSRIQSRERDARI